LIAMLDDPSARVQYFAAQGLGKFSRKDAIPSLVKRIAENADQDPALRHGCIMGLAGSADDATLVGLAKHESPSVRLAAVVALRRHNSAAVSTYLSDADPKVVVEAARAIHDLPLVSEFPKLAALIGKSTNDDALLRRTLNANYRVGGAEQALAIADYAAKG